MQQIPVKQQVFIKRFDGTYLTIDCMSSDRIIDLKKRIYEKDGFDFEWRLSCDKNLNNERTLAQYNIRDQATIHILARIKGGNSCDLFEFTSFQKREVRKIAETAPDWRILSPGLNMQGVCQSSLCKAYNELALSAFGLGTFNIARLLLKTLCPLCKQVTKADGSCYFFDCIYEIEGRKSGSNKDYLLKDQIGKQDYIYFKGSDSEDKCSWIYLEIKTYQK